MSQLKIKNGNSWESIPAGGVGVPSGGDAGDILVKSSSVDYATEWEHKGMDLLWTNTSPATAFGAQTIALDLTMYDMAMILYKYSSTTSGQQFQLEHIVSKNDGEVIMLYGTGQGAGVFRTASVTGSGVAFSAVYNSTLSNAEIIPYKIYGIKI